MVAGQSLELDCSFVLGLTSRYVEARGDGAAGFIKVMEKDSIED